MTVIKAEIVEAGWIVDGYNLARGVTAGTNLQALIGKLCSNCDGNGILGGEHEGATGWYCPLCAGIGLASVELTVPTPCHHKGERIGRNGYLQCVLCGADSGEHTSYKWRPFPGTRRVTVRVLPKQIEQLDDGRYLLTGTQVDR